MTKRSTKRALLMSALALVVCLSMLVGTTFAWFTDSVTSSGNKIVAGKLEVDLLMGTAVDTCLLNTILILCQNMFCKKIENLGKVSVFLSLFLANW